MTILLDPIFDTSAGTLHLLARRALHHSYLAFLIEGPVSLETQKDDPPASARMKSTESHQAGFLRGYRKGELAQSFRQRGEKPFCIFTVLKGTDEIVRVSDYHGSTFAVSLDDLFKPQIKRKMQVNISQHRRYNPTLRGPRFRMNHLTIRL